ncbi:ferredoxin reductase [Cellulosimicrobium marinum]|uniref:ferredoxin reductase n=1 Tax=Cellulosimicrobium marinum TaxID=1638992 RepID=UPI001E474727|nr:ferredoxin reductase [Cellulosimicrobium marinum]MCB7135920.1 ferredoxin reductase [Cellulosimicrobium marinum]
MTEAAVPGATAPAPGARLGARYAMPTGWRVARLVDARAESPTARTLVLEVPDWPGHLAGQHLDLRLTAPDGYTAERSYSIASAASDAAATAHVEITVQRVTGGEVSGYLTDGFTVGDAIEVRGPVGGWFVWSPERHAGRPVALTAGGSGIAPLMAMLRTRRDAGDRTPFRLVYSVRTPDDRLYVDELDRLVRADDGLEAHVAYTRGAPLDASREPGRVSLAELAAWTWPAQIEPACFVCGPTGFVEAVSRALVVLGHDPAVVKTERFGPAVD